MILIDSTAVASAKNIAIAQGLDPTLVCAVIEQESGWNTYAIRYEPGFMAKYVAPLYTTNKINATEAYARSFSWGLMQTMGQVAREIGYTDFLPKLCDPATGVLIGCKVLKMKLDKAKGDVREGLLLWNGGANEAYPGEVLARIPKYR